MAYTATQLLTDLKTQALTLHLAYRRAKFVIERWNSGFSTQVTDDDTLYGGVKGSEIHDLIDRCNELIADYEATGSIKLNTILILSDLQLPDLD